MKTLKLSADDIQQFTKLIYDQQRTAAAGAAVTQMDQSHLASGVNSIYTSPQQQQQSQHIMSLQYYLKHPTVTASTAGAGTTTAAATTTNVLNTINNSSINYPTTVIQSHHHPHHPQNLRLKQPSSSSLHHHLPNGYHTHQHHPYYGGTQQQQQHNATIHHHLVNATTTATVIPQTTLSTVTTPHNRNRQNTSVPVHALNQNSNFSAASSSTGGGTASSHAPTQQSNTTGPSLSPPAAVSANARTQSAANKTTTASSNSVIAPPPRYTIVNASKLSNSGISGGGSSAGNAKRPKTEPLLSQLYQSERLNFATAHLNWTQEHWKRLLIQDERKFNLDGPDGYSNYYHDLRNYERTLSQRPRGISVYVYLLITAAGPIHLDVSTTKVRAESVIEILLRQRTNINAKLGSNGDFLLQDHNWTANALPSAQELLNSEGIKTQKWPTVAHDTNIMENIWGWMIREVYDGGRKFSRKDDLIFRIREAWVRLPMDLIRNLYSTLPERVSELYLTRGAYTNC